MTKRMAVPLIEYDRRFVYADDSLRLSWREIAKCAIGIVIGVVVMWAIAFGISVL